VNFEKILDSNTLFTGQSKYYPILLDSNTSKNEYLSDLDRYLILDLRQDIVF